MAKKKSKISERQKWKLRFIEKAGEVHKRKLPKFADRMLKRADSWKGSLVSRSKKHNVECNITLTELRQLLFDAYGTECKYCGRILNINTLVLDHTIPISKNGASNLGNLQVICKKSNSMKGSLEEEGFNLLLEWLDSIPEYLAKDISIRLSRGIH